MKRKEMEAEAARRGMTLEELEELLNPSRKSKKRKKEAGAKKRKKKAGGKKKSKRKRKKKKAQVEGPYGELVDATDSDESSEEEEEVGPGGSAFGDIRTHAELLQQLFQAPAAADEGGGGGGGGSSTGADGSAAGDDESDSEDDVDVENDAQQRAVIEHALATARSPGHLSKGVSPTAATVSCILSTVTFYANHAHNLTRSP